MKKFILGVISIMILFTASCSQNAKLYNGLIPQEVENRPADDIFINAVSDFSIELFKRTVSDNDNSLISPLSVFIALSMTANGANNNTLSQIRTVMGDISTDTLNEYINTYTTGLIHPKGYYKLNIANSIWYHVHDVEPHGGVQPELLSDSRYFRS